MIYVRIMNGLNCSCKYRSLSEHDHVYVSLHAAVSTVQVTCDPSGTDDKKLLLLLKLNIPQETWDDTN